MDSNEKELMAPRRNEPSSLDQDAVGTKSSREFGSDVGKNVGMNFKDILLCQGQRQGTRINPFLDPVNRSVMIARFVNLAECLAARWGIIFDDKLGLAKRERASLNRVGVICQLDTKDLDGVLKNPSGLLLFSIFEVSGFDLTNRWRKRFGECLMFNESY